MFTLYLLLGNNLFIQKNKIMKKLNVLLSIISLLFILTLSACGCQKCEGGNYDGQENCSKSRILKTSFKNSCTNGGGKIR